MSDKEKQKVIVGCATVVFAFPANIIWWVLFGLILHRTEASTAEWCLYVGYLVLSVVALAVGCRRKTQGHEGRQAEVELRWARPKVTNQPKVQR